MSLARDAVRGSAWVMATSLGARAIGVVGTLVLTRFLTPEIYGEVEAAVVVITTAGQLSTLGLGQYVIVHRNAGRDLAFFATLYHVGLGILALGLAYIFSPVLARLIGAPGMLPFVGGMVISGLIDRFSFMPERILVRDMRFSVVGLARTSGELAFTAASLGLAYAGFGGRAIVYGNIARSLLRLSMMGLAADRRSWLELHRPSWSRTRPLFAFGAPLSIGATAGFAARRWDNVLVLWMFGPAAGGIYKLAYNLADIPAVQVGEQITDVMLPAFTRVDPARRPDALVRSLSLLSLVMSPLAVGLGGIATTLVRSLFDARWMPVAPMLAVLASLSAVRPFGSLSWSYLQAREKPRALMALEVAKLVGVLGLVFAFGQLGPLWACAGVGVAFGAHALAGFFWIDRDGGPSVMRQLGAVFPPLLACLPMLGAILAVRGALNAAHVPALVVLAAEIIVGALAYVVAALIVARTVSRDFLRLVRDAFGRRIGARKKG